MKARGLLNLCVMLLWFVATYHCALEQLIAKCSNQPFSQTSTSSEPDCPSHPSDDPSSHSEGKACGTIFQASSSSQLQDSSQVEFVSIVSSLLADFSSFDYLDQYLSSSAASFESTHSAALSQRAYSLSIAPNAPPVTLA